LSVPVAKMTVPFHQEPFDPELFVRGPFDRSLFDRPSIGRCSIGRSSIGRCSNGTPFEQDTVPAGGERYRQDRLAPRASRVTITPPAGAHLGKGRVRR